MATVYSDYFTVNEVGTYDYKGPTQAIRGQVVGFSCSFASRTPATGDLYRIIKVPKGAKLLTCMISNADLGTDCPGTLGWESADPDAHSLDVVLETANTAASESTTANVATQGRISTAGVTAAEDYLTITIGTVNTGAAGAVTVTGSWFVP